MLLTKHILLGTVVVGAVSLIFLTGCTSQNKPQTLAVPNVLDGARTPGSAQNPAPPTQTAQAAQNNIPAADPNTPNAQYVNLKGGDQVATLYYALSGLPPDYDKLCQATSIEYRNTSDSFRKHDLMQALLPKINSQISAYKDVHGRYFKYDITSGGQLGHYDFTTQAFPFEADITPDVTYRFDDDGEFHFNFTNGSKFTSFPMADQQKARSIESDMTSGLGYSQTATLYLYANAADLSSETVNFQIVKIVIYGPHHAEIGQF